MSTGRSEAARGPLASSGAEGNELEPFATGPVALVAVAMAAVLLAVASRYGWHRDELYFLEAGKHLAWGYVDQPPFTPFVAHVADTIAPGNLVVLRTLPAVATAGTVVLVALLARELGGGRRAQVLAAVSAAGGFALGVGHLLSTATFDLTASMALLLLIARVLRTGDTRWWVAVGAVAGLAALNKDVGLLLFAAVGAGIAVERRWELLRTRWLAVGIGLAVLLASPNLIWQAMNGWPQLEMARALNRRIGGENRTMLLPLQLVFGGTLVCWVLFRGVRELRGDVVRRALLWAWPVGLVLAFVAGGRPYYVLPLTYVVIVAGFVESDRLDRVRSVAWCLAISIVFAVPVALPVLPTSMIGGPIAAANEVAVETVGWPELARQVAGVVHDLPAGDQAHVVLLAFTYGEAGALDHFGPALGLPPAYSGHNSYADFREPSDPDAVVVAIRFDPAALEPYFRDCTQVATVDNGLDVHNEVQGQPIVVCRGLRESWPVVWASLRHLD